VGRNGRREGKPQYFRGFCSDEEELVLLAACVSLELKRISENILFPKKAFHILAHQAICLCLQKLGTTADEIWNTVKDAYCFSEISRDEFDQLLQYMTEYKYDFSKLIGKVWKTGIRQRTLDATMEFYKGDSVCIIGLLRRGGTALFNTTTKNSFGTQLNQIHFLPTLVVVFV